MILTASALLALTAFPGAGELPLEEPFGIWVRHLEAAGEGLYPSVLPARLPFEASGGFRGLSEYLALRASRPSRSLLEGRVSWGGEAALQGYLADGSFENAAGMKLRAGGELAGGLTFDHQLSLWTGTEELPPGGFSAFHIHPNGEPGRHLYPDWGWMDYTREGFSLRLGRFSQEWGPGRFTQLLLSDNSPALDQLRGTFRITDGVDLTCMTATVEPDSGSWFSAHRLDILPTDNLRIGLYEAAFYTTATLDLAYTNPVLFWYSVQWHEQDDDNLFFGMDAIWKPRPGLAAYVEWLVDDIQYQSTYNRPNKMGATGGIDWVHPGTGLAVAAEYTAIAKYVYSQKHPRNYFLHNDRIIGSELGPDADRITLSVGWACLEPLTAELRGSLTRHGEGTVYDGFGDTVTTGEPWPSGIVEYTREVQLNLSWRLSGGTTLFGSAGYSRLTNAGNVQDSTASEATAMLRLVYGL